MRSPESISIVPIQAGARGSEAVFLIPGAGASVTSFLSLAECLGPQVTVFGLQPRGLDGLLPPHTTVEAAAAEFLAGIRKVCPGGPYRIAGHSFGGWIAHEIALRLESLGESLRPLVMIDSEPPDLVVDAEFRSASEPDRRVRMLLKLVWLLEKSASGPFDLGRRELELLGHRQQLEALAEAMKRTGLLSRASKLAAVENMVRVFDANLRTDYVPAGALQGEVVLVLPEEELEDDPDEIHLDAAQRLEQWRRFVPSLRSVATPGNHITMLDGRNAESVGRLLRALWSGT